MRTLLPFLALATASLSAAPAWNYPEAEKGNVVDNYFGTAVADPYRWMEELDLPQTKEWVKAENTLTFDFLEKLPERQIFHERLTKLWNYPRYGLPSKEGGQYFFTKNDGLQNQAVLYVQPSLDAAPRVLLDPNTLGTDGTVALSATDVSPDGQWLAYGTATAGSDWNEFRVRSVATGKDTEDYLKWIKFSSVSWTKDNAGFVYSRFPEPKVEEGTKATFSELANQRLYYHRLGTPQSTDRLIFEIPEQPKWFVHGGVTEDGHYLIISTSRGDTNNTLVSYIDLGDPKKPNLDAARVKLIDQWEAQTNVIGDDGSTLFLVTNLNAPKRRIVAVDTRTPEKANWKEIVPEGDDTIEHASIIGGKLVVKKMHDANSHIAIYSKDGASLGDIALPGIGTVAGISGHEDDPELFYDFTSFIYPKTSFRFDLTTGKGSIFQQPKVDFDSDAYETRQIFYTSKDQTKVPMFITCKKGLKLDGTNPTILYGYGGFDIPMTPAFSVSVLAWLEQGGVYAVANLRGGGEYGKEWHEAGTKERKQNVFDDFIAAAEWLISNKYTSTEKLAIRGGSNGGLLIGAVTNQRPDLFAAAIPQVGVMDMLRFHKFTIGYSWISDYGSSDNPEGFQYLHRYSPVHTVKAGTHYPAMLITTGDHDDRVFPAHSFKYAAALQASAYNGEGAKPIFIRIETRAGHGAGKPTSKQIEETADQLAFAAHFVGMELHPLTKTAGN